MFYFSDFSQRLYIVAVLLRRIQLPLTALGLISFPRVQMSPAMLTGNQQNVSGAWHMTTRSDFPYKDNNLPQENGSLESSRTLRCSISWECSFTDRITMYLIVYRSWDWYFWYEWPLLCLWTPTCSVFSNYYLLLYPQNGHENILYRYVSIQYRCITVPWWAATTPGQSIEPEPRGITGTGCGRSTVSCTWWVQCTRAGFGCSLACSKWKLKLSQHQTLYVHIMWKIIIKKTVAT